MGFYYYQLISAANKAQFHSYRAELADPKQPPGFDIFINGIIFHHYIYVNTNKIWGPHFWCIIFSLQLVWAQLPDGLPRCFHLTATSSEVHNSQVAR